MIFVQNIQSVMIWSEIKRILRLLFISVVFSSALLLYISVCIASIASKSKCSVKSFLKENVYNLFRFDLRFGCCNADMYLLR